MSRRDESEGASQAPAPPSEEAGSRSPKDEGGSGSHLPVSWSRLLVYSVGWMLFMAFGSAAFILLILWGCAFGGGCS